MRQGGQSYNKSPGAKKGIRSRSKCSICGREYKLDYYKARHERLCKELNEVENG